MDTGPGIDPSDMKTNQKELLGVDTYNVEEDYQATLDAASSGMPDNAVDTSVNQGFVDDAPNLPFQLPFGLDKLFGKVFHHGKETKHE